MIGLEWVVDPEFEASKRCGTDEVFGPISSEGGWTWDSRGRTEDTGDGGGSRCANIEGVDIDRASASECGGGGGGEIGRDLISSTISWGSSLIIWAWVSVSTTDSDTTAVSVIDKLEETRCLRLNAGMIMVRLGDLSWDPSGRTLLGRDKGGVVEYLEELEGVGVSGMRGRISEGPDIRAFGILAEFSGCADQSGL
jgi:hypothetical protein